MIPLILGRHELLLLHRVRDHAEANRYDLAATRRFADDFAAGRPTSPADDERFRAELPFGFRVAFTIEEHPGGWFRHLSVSIAGRHNPPRLPNKPAVCLIGKELGMRAQPEGKGDVWHVEGGQAVNFIEPMAEPAG